MSDCLECGQKVRNSDPICADCLEEAAVFVALVEFAAKMKPLDAKSQAAIFDDLDGLYDDTKELK